MKKIKTIIGALLILGTYFPAYYGATTELVGMQLWGVMICICIFFAGLILIVSDNA